MKHTAIQLLKIVREKPLKLGPRVFQALKRRAVAKCQMVKDRVVPTFPLRLNVCLSPIFDNTLLLSEGFGSQRVSYLSRFLAHEFDLLGSGWQKVEHGVNCRGLAGYQYSMGTKVHSDSAGEWLEKYLNKANLACGQEVWVKIFEGDFSKQNYTPIDWQLDFKSGYRWSEAQHVCKIKFGEFGGVDIKVPWELSRLQHLPQLALWAASIRVEDPLQFHEIVVEIRAQILDFIALNPPRYGVNWRCPMDIAIRNANLIFTHSILGPLDSEFEQILGGFVVVQVEYICSNLEWSEDARGNHYYANIFGLLFSAVALPQSPKTGALLAFSIQEFFKETERQFLADGALFEGSTGYHRLVSEMLFWGSALIRGIEPARVIALDNYENHLINVRPPFKSATESSFSQVDGKVVLPKAFQRQIYKAAHFLECTMHADGKALKIGDYDSGRPLKLFPCLSTSALDETCVQETVDDHSEAIQLFNGLRGDVNGLQGAVCALLSKHRYFDFQAIGRDVVEGRVDVMQGEFQLNNSTSYCFEFPSIDASKIERFAFPDFGIYIWKSDEFYLSVRCYSTIGEREWGHFHDDNLSLELFVHGKSYICDPGSYVYTPLPDERRIYQSAAAHFVPRVSGQKAIIFGPSLFQACPLASGECREFLETSFVGQLVSEEWMVQRKIRISSTQLEIVDSSEDTKVSNYAMKFEPQIMDTKGYGKKTENPVYTL